MKRLITALLLFCSMLVMPATAQADWRWAKPHFKKKTVAYICDTPQCIRHMRLKLERREKRMIKRYHERRLREWRHWTRLYIPTCTWYGESGTGPQYARYRYTLPNSGGSGAYGKFQFKGPTYHSRAKYHDWSALDQEIAARREFWAHGTGPWANCH